MKTSILLLACLCVACTRSVDVKTDETAVKQLIDDHTRYGASADSVNWAKYWSQTDEDMFTNTSANGSVQLVLIATLGVRI